MRIRRRGWLIIAGGLMFFAVLGAIPILHPLELAHGDIYIQGFFPARVAPQGFHHVAVRDSRGELLFRAFDLRIGPFAWELTLQYFHS